ncbi:MAG: transposase [Streptosporangiaceae bacterium]
MTRCWPGRGITPAEAARHAGISWPVAHEAFAAAAGPVLEQALAPVAHLGIYEHRRGRPRWERDQETGEYVLLADRWHTCFFDLSGEQGLLGQVEGRTADDTAYWLAGASPAWRDAVRVVAIDMCSIYACAVRRMLPARPVRQDRQHPAGGSGRAGDRRRLDREGETPPRPEPARPRHRLGPVRAGRPGPAQAGPHRLHPRPPAQSRTATSDRTHPVTGPKPRPG